MKKNIIYIILFAFIISSCTERIDIEVDDSFTRLVVEADISYDRDQKIYLSKTSDYFEAGTPDRVSNAKVSIIGINGTEYPFTENPENKGEYLHEGAPYYRMSPVVGQKYTLKIELEEEVGGYKDYEATSVVHENCKIDSIGFDYFPGSPVTLVRLYADDPEGPSYYTYSLFKNDVLVTDSLSELNFAEDRIFDGGRIDGIGVGFFNEFKEDEVLTIGDTIKLRVASIDEQYYEFLYGVSQEIGFSIPLFSGPPANIKGNISNGAIGYFAIYRVDFIENQFFGFPDLQSNK